MKKWVLVAQSYLTLFHPLNCQAPLSMESSKQEYWSWIAIPFFRGYSWPRDQTQISYITGKFFTAWATREAQM